MNSDNMRTVFHRNRVNFLSECNQFMVTSFPILWKLKVVAWLYVRAGELDHPKNIFAVKFWHKCEVVSDFLKLFVNFRNIFCHFCQ